MNRLTRGSTVVALVAVVACVAVPATGAAPRGAAPTDQARYLTMRDGVKIAIDVSGCPRCAPGRSRR
jgi:hypothetical protein